MFDYLEYWEQQPTPVQILSGQVQSPRYSQSGHTEMLHSIPITGVSRKRKDQFTRRASANLTRRTNLIQLRGHPSLNTGLLANMRPELVGRLNVVPITGFQFCFRLSCSLCRFKERCFRNSKAMIERKLWQPKHCKQWSIKLINLMGGIFQDEYFLKDADRVTKKLFLEWIEWPNKNLQATELLREFKRQYSQLSKVEKLTLELNKVDQFLQGADGELQGKLKLLLKDKEEDEGLTTKWKNVENAVELLTKKERRKDRSNIPKIVQAPKALVRTTPPTMPTIQPSTSLSKIADMGMEEIIRGMRDLQIKLARLEENTSTNNSKNVSKQGYVQRCIWCDDASHTRKDCNEFNNMIRQGIICWKDGKIALKDRDDLLQTNFGKGGMRALIQDYLKEYETAARESASYGARIDDEIGGSTETSEFWTSVVSTMQKGKLPQEALLRTAATIRGRTG
uniref:Predicted protein n=1 Tax=Physcomitrium patens TaxID=3218 RepID=A9TMG5_PHYPA